jgi:hypothetical protein
VVANHRLALRSLAISDWVHGDPVVGETLQAICRLLVSCKDPRTIRFNDNILWTDLLDHTKELQDALTKVESVIGPPRIVRALIPGRPFHSITSI